VRRLLALALGLACLGSPDAAHAARQHVFAFYSRAGGAELSHLRRVAARIDILAPNWYTLDLVSGAVGPRPPDAALRRLGRRRGFSLWPVVNAQAVGEPLPAGSWGRDRIATAVAALAQRYRYRGITLDLEGLDASQRDAMTALVAALARRLHGAGRRLAVYVPRPPGSGWLDTRGGLLPPDGAAAAYDWPALARLADLVLASTYNEHWAGGEPGPVTTTAGLGAVVARAASVSRAKIAPILGAFGYDWPRDGGAGRLVSTLEAGAHAARAGRIVRLHDGAGTYRYGRRVVWYQTARGLRRGAGLVGRAGMRWLALFSLGREPLSLWRSL
jgi:spore germination protein YaaH